MAVYKMLVPETTEAPHSVSPGLMGSTTRSVDGRLTGLEAQHGEQCQLSSTGALSIAQHCRCGIGFQDGVSPSPGPSAAPSFTNFQKEC